METTEEYVQVVAIVLANALNSDPNFKPCAIDITKLARTAIKTVRALDAKRPSPRAD
jgi:hypothetical protein